MPSYICQPPYGQRGYRKRPNLPASILDDTSVSTECIPRIRDLGVIMGINLVGAMKWLKSGKETMTSLSSKSSRLLDFGLLAGANLASYFFFMGSKLPTWLEVLKADKNHILDWHHNFLIGLPVVGFLLAFMVPYSMKQLVRAPVNRKVLKLRVFLLVLLVFLAGTLVTPGCIGRNTFGFFDRIFLLPLWWLVL